MSDGLKLFKTAIKHGAVDARSGAFTQGNTAFPSGRDAGIEVLHCFNKQGKEVCLFIPGVSKSPRFFSPPRTWVPSLAKRLRVIVRKEDI